MVRLLSLQVRCSRGRPLKDVKVLLAQQVYSDTGVDEAALAPNDTEVLFKGQVRLCLCVFFFLSNCTKMRSIVPSADPHALFFVLFE
jgi:hypothetical protein